MVNRTFYHVICERWTRRVGELMDGVGGSNTLAGKHALTDITLGLLEDTGWYHVHYNTAGFNHWGWNAGCTFAEGACIASASPSGEFYCDVRDADIDEKCTFNRLATGICTEDTHSTLDGCYRVYEFSNGACAQPAAERPGESVHIDGWYRGPFSRCIQESPGFGRNGYRYLDGSVNAQCYEMRCDGGALYVVVDSVRMRCPDGGYIYLDQYPGALEARFHPPSPE